MSKNPLVDDMERVVEHKSIKLFYPKTLPLAIHFILTGRALPIIRTGKPGET